MRCYAFEEQRALDQTRAIAVWAIPEIGRLELKVMSFEASVEALTRAVSVEKGRGDFYRSFAESLRKEKETQSKIDRALTIVPWTLVVVQGIIMSALGGWIYGESRN